MLSTRSYRKDQSRKHCVTGVSCKEISFDSCVIGDELNRPGNGSNIFSRLPPEGGALGIKALDIIQEKNWWQKEKDTED